MPQRKRNATETNAINYLFIQFDCVRRVNNNRDVKEYCY